MHIKQMRQQDIAAVAALEKALFSDAWSEAMLESGLRTASQHFFCAWTEAGSLAGYAAMMTVLDESELLRIGTQPLMQGKGIGSALMEAVLAQAARQQASVMLLEVRRGNTPAVGLYRKYGFAEAGIRKDYYQSPTEDALIMRRIG